MIILGLTGSIGMGKSTVLKILRLVYRVPVWDADHVARKLLATNRSVIDEVSKEFPGVVRDHKIDRRALRDITFQDKKQLAKLEVILHPILRSKAIQFIMRMQRERHSICALEIPLLFESDWDEICTHTVVAYTADFIQESRVLRRIGMTRDQLKHIRSVQLSTPDKLKRTTFAINTGGSRGSTARQLKDIMTILKGSL